MNLTGVARALGVVYLAVGAAAVLWGLATLAQSRGDLAVGFLTAAGAGLFLGGALVTATIGRAARGGAREALVFLLAAWLTAPMIAAPPFLAAAGPGGVARAYLDAMSAATTTGFAPAFAGFTDAAPLALWWSFLQWIGGGASLLGALVVLAALNLTGPGVHRSVLFTLDPSDALSRLARLAPVVARLYGLVTAGIAVVCLMAGVGLADALCIAFSAPATGGLVLTDGSVSAAGVPLVALYAALFGMGLGAVSIAAHWEAARSGPRAYDDDEEAPAIIVVALAAALFVVASDGWREGELARAIFEGAALALTAGWDAGPEGAAALGAPVVILFALIGGSPLSTAGGIKVLRLMILVRHVGAELRLLSHPSSVGASRFRARVLEQRAVMGLLLYVIGYLAAVAVVATACAAAGAPFTAALAAGAGAVGNMGPVLTLAGGPGAQALLDQPAAALALSLGMAMGRLEVLAFLAVFTTAFWRG